MADWSKSQWQRYIREKAKHESQIVFTDHAIARMRARRVTWIEALQVLRKGVIRREPEKNIRHGTLECRLEYYVAGRDLAVVAAVGKNNPKVIVVTVVDLR